MAGIDSLLEWEVEHTDHSVLRQYNGDGTENPSSLIRPDEVVRASIISRLGCLQPGERRFNILVDHAKGERFVRRFGRGIMKDHGSGYKLAEYIHCLETNKFRLWVLSSTGQVLVTGPEYELYL